ncbi:MAG: hypothetical protein SOI13_05785 [Bifidobacterium mongoliense]|uniref:hypothetical protein n=1 Tax=Bifidobacterium mongoliense TaxID=518643 RepID=UPI002F354F2C
MGWFATVASRFSKGGANAVRIGVPLTVRRAKQTMSRLVLQQPLTALRPTAEALWEVQRTLPMLVTASMDHYCNGPRLVRFQNSGGRQIDVDAVARMHGEAGVLGDAVSIQHMLGDIDDRRGHLGADEVGSVDCTPLAQATTRALASSGTGEPESGRESGSGQGEPLGSARRRWLFALYDQAPDIVEACGGRIAPLLEALRGAGDIAAQGGADVADGNAGASGVTGSDANSVDAATAADTATLNAAIVGAFDGGLSIDHGGALGAQWRAAMLDPEATTTAYMAGIDILRQHGLEVPVTVELV